MIVGTVLAGRYELTGVLGEGGFAIVYSGRDLFDGGEVAVKVLDPESERRSGERERLFREARLTRQLEHPGIVHVRDVAPLAGGRAFLVMERLWGGTLADRLAVCRRLPVEETVSVARQLLRALSAAHEVGVVHRDVNPSNVFLLDGPDVHTKLIDFGIGRDLGNSESRVTAPDIVVGTLGYMAPEQLVGDAPTVASDIYGVGATLYEALTGRPPHAVRHGDIRQVFRAMLAPVEPVASFRANVAPAFAEGVMRALAREADGRHPSCDAMLRACELVSQAA